MEKKPKKKLKKRYIVAIVVVLLIAYGVTTNKGDQSNDTPKTASTSQVSSEKDSTKENEKSVNESSKPANSDLALIVAPGHPKLYGSTAAAHNVWDDADGNKVVFADSNNSYSDDTIILMEGYSHDENNEIIRGFEVYFKNLSQPTTVTLNDALKIAKEYCPEDIVREWYEFNGSECLTPEKVDGEDETCFHISYGLTDAGNKAYQDGKHSYSGTIDFVFYGEKNNINSFTVGFGTPRWMSSLSANGYKTVNWDYDFLK